jgi:hypothetical protein
MTQYWLRPAGLLWVALLVGYTLEVGMGAEAPSLVLRLEVPADVRVGQPVPLTLKLQNTSKHPVELPFSGRPAYDFVVTRPDGMEVWSWSHGQAIQAILEFKTLKPGEALEFAAAWEQRDNEGQPVPSGTYRVQGILRLEPPEKLATEPKSLSISP